MDSSILLLINLQIYVLCITSNDINSNNHIIFDTQPHNSKTVRHLLAMYDGWNVSNMVLPGPNENMVIGYYNNSIYILSGTITTSYVQYDITNDNMINLGLLSKDSLIGYSQFYTQQNSMIYAVSGTILYTCDLRTKCDSIASQSLAIEVNVGLYPCAASTSEYIFVVGGIIPGKPQRELATLEILNISSNTWTTGPLMTTARYYFSCIVQPATHELYAIGGDGGGVNKLKSVEKIQINDILNANWATINDLLIRLVATRAVIYGSDIVVIGGSDNSGVVISEIQVIHCLLGTVSSGGYLNYAVRSVAAINVNNILYAFGGYGGITTITAWQYLDLEPPKSPTNPTTANPTAAIPTTSSTIPTSNNQTTNNPTTAIPTTNNPTTNNPTINKHTTNNPTTNNPTTNNPTTNNPTTNNPTTNNSTTNHQSIAPTNIPSITTTSNTLTADGIYGILVVIEFKYNIELNSTVTTTIIETVNAIILETVTDPDCILSNDEYNIIISNNGQTNFTTFNVSVYVCNEDSKTNLKVAFTTQLETNLIRNIAKNTQIVIPTDFITNVMIGDIISNEGKVEDIASTLASNTNMISFQQDTATSMTYIFIASGCVLCVIGVFCLFCCYKIKVMDKEFNVSQELTKYVGHNNHNNKNNHNANKDPSPTNNMIENNVNVTHVIAVKSPSIDDIITKGYNNNNIGKDEFIVYGDDENEDIEIEGVNRNNQTCGEQEGNHPRGKSPETPLSERHVYSITPANPKRDEDTFTVKTWLETTVGLVQYQSNFIDNGYDTLEFISEITDRSELFEIGILSNQHQIKILNEVRNLNNDNVYLIKAQRKEMAATKAIMNTNDDMNKEK